MAELTYSAIASLDGHVEDEESELDWAVPDEEVHAFVAVRRHAKTCTRVNRC
jgi:hypothetical protein